MRFFNFLCVLVLLYSSPAFAQIKIGGKSIRLPKDVVPNVEIPSADKVFSKLGMGDAMTNLLDKSPVSTSFDDAIYEASALTEFNPEEHDYQSLQLQPQTASGAFLLKSGLYSMDVRSFCLKAGTYGPSAGDGHLYAPMKGKQAEFVKAILERYGQHPNIPQQNIQVLLWAVIAGADMERLSDTHAKTLNALFSTGELLKYHGRDYLKKEFTDDVQHFQRQFAGKIPPEVQKVLHADDQLRRMVTENRTYQELESIAVLAGIAPASDMIRQVSRGRWSYHPDGYFVRFFPAGYQRTRVDVFVPYEGTVNLDEAGMVQSIQQGSTTKEVVLNLTAMVATPANRSSQRIGLSPVPLDSCGKNTAAYWKQRAQAYQLAQPKTNIVNQQITCSYAQMYLTNPAKYKWAGLAAIVSGKVGESQDDYKKFDGFTDFKKNVFQGNRDIFNDLFWLHLAYEETGIEEIKRLYCNKMISKMVYDGWIMIDEGNVWEGSKLLLYHEQKEVVQKSMYEEYSIIWRNLDLTGDLKCPIPGDNSIFPGDNIANFEERWSWIEQHILPEWQQFESNPANREILIKSLKEACPSCCK